MDEPHLRHEFEELARLADESYDQYLSNGTTKFVMLINSMLSKSHDVNVILTGSSADGSKVDGSDIDVMISPRSIVLDETRFEYNDQCPCHFKIPREMVNAGLSKYISDEGKYLETKSLKGFPVGLFKMIAFAHKCVQVRKMLRSSKVGLVFSQAHLTNPQSKSEEDTIEHHVDFVPAFQISGCRNYIEAWSHRQREWPTPDIVESIICGKFHAVAKVSPLNGDDDKDFCLSFTVAEKTLITSMSEEHLLCMRILKLIGSKLQIIFEEEYLKCFGEDGVKQDLENLSPVDIFSSYRFKTALFWISENEKPSYWTNTKNCVYRILGYFQDCLERRHLPQYFVPSMNLLSGISDESITLASKVLHTFMNSDKSVHNVVTSLLYKTPAALSTTNLYQGNEPPHPGLEDLLGCYKMLLELSKCDFPDEPDLTTDLKEVHNIFREFIYPRMVMQEQSKHGDSEVRETEATYQNHVESRRDGTLNSSNHKKYKKYQPRMINSRKTIIGSILDYTLSIVERTEDEEKEFPNPLTSLFPDILKTLSNRVAQNSESSSQSKRSGATCDFMQSTDDNDTSVKTVNNGSGHAMLVEDVQMDIDLD